MINNGIPSHIRTIGFPVVFFHDRFHIGGRTYISILYRNRFFHILVIHILVLPFLFMPSYHNSLVYPLYKSCGRLTPTAAAIHSEKIKITLWEL